MPPRSIGTSLFYTTKAEVGSKLPRLCCQETFILLITATQNPIVSPHEGILLWSRLPDNHELTAKLVTRDSLTQVSNAIMQSLDQVMRFTKNQARSI